MKRSRILLVLAILTVISATSSRAQTGIMGGVNIASVSASVDGSDVSTDDRTAFNVGVFAGKGGLLGFMTGLFYSQKGFAVEGSNVDLDYLTIPLMLRAKILMLRGYVGPNIAFQLACNTSDDVDLAGVRFSCDDTETFEFGWKIGVGGSLLIFNLDLAYEWGTTDIWKADNGSIKNRAFQIDIGLGI
ncbi:MAG: hypothetical protein AMS21_03410 [Gemmatimonas sp. SG8_38_2]|nr:MAG: hypothetical protein AMS21_03410 [Gemmatimonas sp. SG8_38_2]